MKEIVVKWIEPIIGEAIKSVYISLDEKIDRSVLSTRISALSRKYIKALEERIKYIHLPYMADQRLLAELFVELYVFKTPIKYRLRDEYLFDDTESTNQHDTKEILKNHIHILILGEPGAGKTTFLRRIAYSICTGESASFFGETSKAFPILIECRGRRIPNAIKECHERTKLREAKVKKMVKEKRSSDYINRVLPAVPPPLLIAAAEELKEYGFPYPEKFTQDILKKGNLMLFVDGLDESPIKFRRQITEGLTFIKDHYPKNRSILTCRSAEDDFLPNGFDIFEISPLRDEQKQKFVNLWFSKHQEEAKSFLEKVVRTHIWSISDRPLLLSLLCALYEAGGDLPRYKVDLYRECAELALRRWDAIRFVKRHTVFKSLSHNQRMDILSKIAAEMMKDQITQISRGELEKKISFAMEEGAIEGPPRILLDEFISHTGLIQQVALNTYSFSHKSLQEYCVLSASVRDRVRTAVL